jgi:secondary thiamine-phosphate synthase enzyme
MKTHALAVRTRGDTDVLDITPQVEQRLGAAKDGLCVVFVRHTTAGLSVGEYSEGTGEDLLEVMQKIVPEIDFRHGHDPSHAPDHMASSILGASLSIPVVGGKLALGTWQRILLLEFNGPREREILVQVWE